MLGTGCVQSEIFLHKLPFTEMLVHVPFEIWEYLVNEEPAYFQGPGYF